MPPLDRDAIDGKLDPIGKIVNRPPRKRGTIAVALAATWLSVVILAALTAQWLPLEKYSVPVGDPRLPPSLTAEFLGTDALGRSVLSRMIYGARVSLLVGVLSVLIAMLVGGSIGLVAGYVRGKVESVVNVLMDSLLAFPPLFLLLVLNAVFTQSMKLLIISLAAVITPTFYRLARANTRQFAEREFVEAARSMGAPSGRIMLREVLPNIIFPVASYSFLMVAVVAVAEGSLSFLGLGIPAPVPSWGGMISAGREFLEESPALVFVPAGALLLTVLSFNVIGDRVRRHFDVRESGL